MSAENSSSTLPLTTRLCLHFIAWASLAAVGIALVSQHWFDMQPCAWCVFQRFLYLCLTLLCWLGLLAGRWSAAAGRIACALAALLAFGGAVSAWYQYDVASNMASCAQTLADRFIVESGLEETVPWLFGVFGSCADAKVELLGFEYVLWSLALFTILLLAALTALRARKRP
jgi:disulfide bond formation protein DsbB